MVKSNTENFWFERFIKLLSANVLIAIAALVASVAFSDLLPAPSGNDALVVLVLLGAYASAMAAISVLITMFWWLFSESGNPSA